MGMLPLRMQSGGKGWIPIEVTMCIWKTFDLG